MATRTLDTDDFIPQWNALDRRERFRLRRLVRLGRPIDDPGKARLARAYADVQRGRIWIRLFWWWFVPGLAIALGVAAQLHPLVIGVVLALAAQAVLTRRNLGRVERVNARALGG